MLPVAAMALLAGCFGYVPVEPGTVPEGADVRLHLTRQGVADLPEIPGQEGEVVAGTLLRRSDGQVQLRVPIRVRNQGFPTQEFSQEVGVPARDIVVVEERRLSRARTGLLVAGGLAAVVLAITSFDDGRQDQSPQIPPPPEEGIRIPIFSFPAW